MLPRMTAALSALLVTIIGSVGALPSSQEWQKPDPNSGMSNITATVAHQVRAMVEEESLACVVVTETKNRDTYTVRICIAEGTYVCVCSVRGDQLAW